MYIYIHIIYIIYICIFKICHDIPMMHLRFPNKNFQERRLLEAQKDQASLAAEDNEAFAAAQEGLQRQRQEQLGTMVSMGKSSTP